MSAVIAAQLRKEASLDFLLVVLVGKGVILSLVLIGVILSLTWNIPHTQDPENWGSEERYKEVAED